MTDRIGQPAAMRAWSRAARQAGRKVVFVPTMGALHDGHLALLRAAARLGDAVVASIFVNPAQFGPGEDFDRYPRPLAADLEACAAAGAHAVFVPPAGSLYAADHSTWVVEESLALPLEGECRPGHFRGMLTVVLKLLHIVEPDTAVFGQKDAQQALLIRRMVRDLDLPVQLAIEPTVREPDGLALSSRNAGLEAEERRRAPVLARALHASRARLAAGETDLSAARAAGLALLDAAAAAGGTSSLAVDYFEVVDLDTLRSPARPGAPLLIAGAIRLGRTRLIDNLIHNPQPHAAEGFPT